MICRNCGIEITGYHNYPDNVCSFRCLWKRIKKNKTVELSICKVCGKYFIRKKSESPRRRLPRSFLNVRKRGVNTCSPKCSREHNDKIQYYRRNR